jgi:hypothetical protein
MITKVRTIGSINVDTVISRIIKKYNLDNIDDLEDGMSIQQNCKINHIKYYFEIFRKIDENDNERFLVQVFTVKNDLDYVDEFDVVIGYFDLDENLEITMIPNGVKVERLFDASESTKEVLEQMFCSELHEIYLITANVGNIKKVVFTNKKQTYDLTNEVYVHLLQFATHKNQDLTPFNDIIVNYIFN